MRSCKGRAINMVGEVRLKGRIVFVSDGVINRCF